MLFSTKYIDSGQKGRECNYRFHVIACSFAAYESKAMRFISILALVSFATWLSFFQGVLLK